MSDFGLSACERADTSAFTGVSYSPGGANTKGNYTQIVASTSFRYEGVRIALSETAGSGGGEAFLTDIAVGASGSEVVIIPNLYVDNKRQTQAEAWYQMCIPVSIPEGSRIAARTQIVGGAGTRIMGVKISGLNGGFNFPRSFGGVVQNYGANTAATNGQPVVTSATAGVFGSWVQLTASTVANHNWLQAMTGGNNSTSSPSATDNLTWQIGIGTSGSEVVIFEDDTSTIPNVGVWGNLSPCYAAIPAGTRIAVRVKGEAVSAADTFSALLLAV